MRADRSGSTDRRKAWLFSRSGEMSSTSSSPASMRPATAGQSSGLVELIVAATRPMRLAAATWSRIRASSGDTTSVGPAPARRRRAVAIH